MEYYDTKKLMSAAQLAEKAEEDKDFDDEDDGIAVVESNTAAIRYTYRDKQVAVG